MSEQESREEQALRLINDAILNPGTRGRRLPEVHFIIEDGPEGREVSTDGIPRVLRHVADAPAASPNAFRGQRL